MHLTRGPQQFPEGSEPAYGWGLPTPLMSELGLQAARYPQADRLEVSRQLPLAEDPATWGRVRAQDDRTLDAGRILDYGAPAPARVVEYAPFPYRPTELPSALDRPVALGGRLIYVGGR